MPSRQGFGGGSTSEPCLHLPRGQLAVRPGLLLMQRVGIGTGTRREKMGMAMGNALALARWHGFRSFNGSLRGDDMTWLLIGLVFAVVIVWALRRRRRRWF